MARADTLDKVQLLRRRTGRLRRTPGLVLGPFYPVHLAGRPGVQLRQPGTHLTVGRPLELSGRVLDPCGEALCGALLEVWHADSFGRYQHPGQPGIEKVDPAFFGYEALTSQNDGAWRLASVVPGAYAHEGVQRAPHLHFQVTFRSTRLVTQMFFPDHALNPSDRWYQASTDPSLLLATRQEDGSLQWDIVLAAN